MKKMDELAKSCPSFHELREAVKIVAMVKLLQEKKIELAFPDEIWNPWHGPDSVQGFISTTLYQKGPQNFSASFSIQGGVDLTLDPNTTYLLGLTQSDAIPVAIRTLPVQNPLGGLLLDGPPIMRPGDTFTIRPVLQGGYFSFRPSRGAPPPRVFPNPDVLFQALMTNTERLRAASPVSVQQPLPVARLKKIIERERQNDCSKRTVGQGKKYELFPLDSRGRATGVFAIIGKDNPEGQSFVGEPEWWSRLPLPGNNGWDRGHLLAKRFGGPGGQTWANMAAMSQKTNRSYIAQVENQIKRAVDRGYCVYFTVVPIYAGDDVYYPHYFQITILAEHSDPALGAYGLSFPVRNQVIESFPPNPT
jgi:hypothetical protein